jgi:hypothetical protein
MKFSNHELARCGILSIIELQNKMDSKVTTKIKDICCTFYTRRRFPQSEGSSYISKSSNLEECLRVYGCGSCDGKIHIENKL